MSETKLLGSVFYNGAMGTVGLVLINNGREDKAYIGVPRGGTEEEDIRHVRTYGAPFPVAAARKALGLPEETK